MTRRLLVVLGLAGLVLCAACNREAQQVDPGSGASPPVTVAAPGPGDVVATDSSAAPGGTIPAIGETVTIVEPPAPGASAQRRDMEVIALDRAALTARGVSVYPGAVGCRPVGEPLPEGVALMLTADSVDNVVSFYGEELPDADDVSEALLAVGELAAAASGAQAGGGPPGAPASAEGWRRSRWLVDREKNTVLYASPCDDDRLTLVGVSPAQGFPASEDWEKLRQNIVQQVEAAGGVEGALEAAKGRAEKAACVSNMKQLALASLMYAQDYDEIFMGENWTDATAPYLRNDEILRCPSAPGLTVAYALNEGIARLRMARILRPADTVLLFESDAAEKRPAAGVKDFVARHGGEGMVAYTDGHVKGLPPDKSARAIWEPQ